MRISRRVLVTAAAAATIIGVVAVMMAQSPQKQRTGGGRFRGPDGPVPVVAVPANLADVPVYLDGVGSTKAQTVTVRPQVDGKLIKVSFKEGQDVARGFVLAEIDPATYQAQFDQAVAKKGQDEAQLANARLDLERYVRLGQAATKQQADTQRALVAQLEAQVRSDQAAIDNARAILDYTKIIAPIDGRTGIRQVDEGNIVHASDSTGIVVITQIRPISVLFSLPQQNVAQVNKASSQRQLTVEALGPDNRTVTDRGTLQVVDNQVDPTTGTVKLKADFPNAELQLWPGQFVNVRLLIDTLRQVVVVPTAAVQRGPTGTFVYVVKDDDTVTVRAVTTSQQDDTRAVLASGLQQGERVVTTGFTRLTEGTNVSVSSSDAPQPAPATETPRGPRRGNGERRRGQQSDASPRPTQ